VHAWIGASGDSNAGAIETPEGVIVIDTQQYPRLARQLRAAVLGKTGKPLRAVVNTPLALPRGSHDPPRVLVS
jgi:cyclase